MYQICHLVVRPEESAESLEYWTEERMEAAEPYPLAGALEKRSDCAPPPPETSELPGENGVPRVVKNPGDTRPFWNCGKLFFVSPQGIPAHCSAQFVESTQMLMTAGHCIHNQHGFSTKFLFRRAFHNGRGDKIRLSNIFYYCPKFTPPTASVDYAFATTIEKGVGYFGLLPNAPYSSFTAVGYPNNFGNGQELMEVTGTRGRIIDGRVQMLDNPFGPGSSGGAWIGALHVGGKYEPSSNIAIGLNSEGSGRPNAMDSPLFDDKTMELAQHVLKFIPGDSAGGKD